MAATLTTKCPEWCTGKEIEDLAEDGHDGPSWPHLPSDGGFNSLGIFAGANQEGEIVVNISSGYGIHLTGAEAGQWALAHRVV